MSDRKIGPLSQWDRPQVMKLVEKMGVSPAFNWPPEALEPELRWAQGWGVWRGSTLTGFVLWRDTDDRNEITCLATDPEYRRGGDMSFLLRGVIGRLDNAPWLLEVHVLNSAAHALYLSLGFEKVGVRTRYYRDGADAWVYRRPSTKDKPLP